MKRLLYIHDFPFRVSEKGCLHFEVGMPESYFDRFVQAGFTVEVLSRVRAIAPKTNFGSNDPFVRVSLYSKRSYLRNFGMLIFNRKKFSEYDLVVVNYPSINGLIWLSLFFKNPYILEHVNDNRAFSTKRSGIFVYFYLVLFERIFFRRSYGVTSVASYLVSNLYPENHIVSSNVDIEVPGYRSRLLKKPIKLVSVGAVSRKKGIDLVFNQLKSFDMHCHYKIIGAETDLVISELSRSLPAHISVEYLGVLKKDEVWRHLSDADIYVQGSRSEGLPRAVIEAMAFSLPVIASKLPCYVGLIDDEWLIDFYEDGALRRAASKLLEEDKYRLVSIKNYSTSKAFDAAILREKKIGFYRKVANELHAD